MTIILQAILRLGVVLTALGVGAVWFGLPTLVLSFGLLTLVSLYLAWSIWTANQSARYNTHRECFVDIAGDVVAYTLHLVLVFLWFYAPKVVSLPLLSEQFWIVAVFLIVMTVITLIELLITCYTCLIAMERQNPISIVR